MPWHRHLMERPHRLANGICFMYGTSTQAKLRESSKVRHIAVTSIAGRSSACVFLGPREAVQHICWHATCQSAVSVSSKGKAG